MFVHSFDDHGHWRKFVDRGGWGRWFGPQVKRGDMSDVLLGALATKPMHGYELIRYLENQSEGMWRPSPGSVYPTLQLLEEQELVTSHDADGKRVYTLTKQGQERAKSGCEALPWKQSDELRKRFHALHDVGVKAIVELRRVALQGTASDTNKAQTALEDLLQTLRAIKTGQQGAHAPHNARE